MQTIKLLESDDINIIVKAFVESNWIEKPSSLFHKYLDEQNKNERIVWLSYYEDKFDGYITLKWQSEYLLFKERNIPEIKDLNVLPQYRCRGVGTKLMDIAEQEAFKRFGIVGIGVGLYPDYGPAQRLYVKRGYIPDGKGIAYYNRTLSAGDNIVLDDELVLWMLKQKK